MNLDRLTRRLVHLRAVADHIDRNLDDDMRLEDLAEIAHLSRFHFDRVFRDYAGEAPLARVRRLRLMRARRKLESGHTRGLLDLALENGYTSAEAFSRAFRSQFGCTPSSIKQHHYDFTPGAWRIETVAPLAIQYLPYSGAVNRSMHVFDELRARALLQDIPRERRKGWSIEYERSADGSHICLHAALLSERLGTRIDGLSEGLLPAGDYAVLSLVGSYEAPRREEMIRRIEAETGRQLRTGPILRCFHNPDYLPSAGEKRCELYIPVQR